MQIFTYMVVLMSKIVNNYVWQKLVDEFPINCPQASISCIFLHDNFYGTANLYNIVLIYFYYVTGPGPLLSGKKYLASIQLPALLPLR